MPVPEIRRPLETTAAPVAAPPPPAMSGLDLVRSLQAQADGQSGAAWETFAQFLGAHPGRLLHLSAAVDANGLPAAWTEPEISPREFGSRGTPEKLNLLRLRFGNLRKRYVRLALVVGANGLPALWAVLDEERLEG